MRPLTGVPLIQAQLSRDLSRRLQQALLPRNAPNLAGYDIAAGTTLEVEGDGRSLWDWHTLPDGSCALLTLSVTPGSFPPAHSLAMARAFLRELAGEGPDAESLLVRVNSAVSRSFVPGLESAVDCALVVVSAAGTSWFGAGAVHGGVLRREGALEDFPSGGPPLGLLDGFRYVARPFRLEPGDVVLALSHGARGLFRGAADVVAGLHGRPAGEVVSKLQSGLRQVARGPGEGEHSVLFLRRR